MILYENDSTDAAFYFAAEEYIMQVLKPKEPVLMLWRTGDTVMIGANQIVKAEIDEAYAKENSIKIVRRPSGGGTIFTDEETLQYTVILPYDEKAHNAAKTQSDEKIQGDEKTQNAVKLQSDEKTQSDEKIHSDDKTQNAVKLQSDEKIKGDEEQVDTNQTDSDPKACMRKWLAEPLIETLGKLGIHASLEGRNDVTIEGKKISGLAQHIRSGYMCSHGSLLFNTDLEKLVRVLTVDKEKITTKAIASVSARVAKISDHIKAAALETEEKKPSLSVTLNKTHEQSPSVSTKTHEQPPSVSKGEGSIDLKAFREAFIESYISILSAGNENPDEAEEDGIFVRKEFSEDDLTKIEKIMRERYKNDRWTYGREPAFTYTNKKRFPGGQVEVFLDIKGNVIRSAAINGDFLALRPITEIEESLEGVPHKESALREVLKTLDIKNILGSITEDELLQVLN